MYKSNNEQSISKANINRRRSFTELTKHIQIKR